MNIQRFLLWFFRRPVTHSFLLLSVIISVITWFGHFYTPLSALVYHLPSIQSGQVWRLITPIFLHFPAFGIIFAHLAFNMIWLYQFGSEIERIHRSRFLLVLILVAALISNSVQAYFSAGGLFGGMSGVVYALLGYLFVMKKCFPRYPSTVPDNVAYFLIGFMVLSATGLLGQGIANAAHISGFFVGVAIAGWQYFTRRA